MQTVLLIFTKNPLPGRVKTRLAQSIGEERALEVYQELLGYTHQITNRLPFPKMVYYADFVPEKPDIWQGKDYQKKPQQGANLGQRMYQAFREAFDIGYRKVLIIGSDCWELSPEIIQEAEESLAKYSAVIGPAKDGGYYLLGLTRLHKELFMDKTWSHDQVYAEALRDFERLAMSYYELPRLSDIDYYEDLPEEVKERYPLNPH